MGFDFYIPNPKWKAWKKEDDRLKKQKIAKKHRPAEPQRHPNYPTKVKIALNLLQTFCANFPDIQIKCFLADGLYGSSEFLENASSLFEKASHHQDEKQSTGSSSKPKNIGLKILSFKN